MANKESSIAVSIEDMAIIDEIRLSEGITKKELGHKMIQDYFNRWSCI